jgi:hypothetical protein
VGERVVGNLESFINLWQFIDGEFANILDPLKLPGRSPHSAMEPGVQVESGLSPDGAQQLAEANVILHSVIPALNDFHKAAPARPDNFKNANTTEKGG